MSEDQVQRRFPTRRDALRIIALGGAAGVAWKLGLFDRNPGPVTRSRVMMGTEVTLKLVGDDREALEAAADATLERMSELEALLSRYRPDSEVSRLNTSGRLEDPSPALLDVLELADRVWRMGDGGFDITIQPVLDLYGDSPDGRPSDDRIAAALAQVGFDAVKFDPETVRLDRPGMSLTLDGIGKGYVVDGGLAVLKGRGFPDVFIDAGGDLVAHGVKDADTPWRIGIRNPRPGMSLQARFDATDVCVATSGDYMQPFTEDHSQHHILDPRSGRSAPELASSTVIAPSAALADALATLTMVLGSRKSRELLEELPGCEGYFVSKELSVVRTSGFRIV